MAHPLEKLAPRALRLLRRGCSRSCMKTCIERLEALLETLRSQPREVAAALLPEAAAVVAGFAAAAAEEAAEKECWDAYADLREAAEQLARLTRGASSQ